MSVPDFNALHVIMWSPVTNDPEILNILQAQTFKSLFEQSTHKYWPTLYSTIKSALNLNIFNPIAFLKRSNCNRS